MKILSLFLSNQYVWISNFTFTIKLLLFIVDCIIDDKEKRIILFHKKNVIYIYCHQIQKIYYAYNQFLTFIYVLTVYLNLD